MRKFCIVWKSIARIKGRIKQLECKQEFLIEHENINPLASSIKDKLNCGWGMGSCAKTNL
jgi:hypothetical protein